MVSLHSPRVWDPSMTMLASPSNSTPSARFAVDTTSGLKARLWVEEVIGRRLPEGDFAAGFKDGVGLCELLNAFKPGTIPKIETSKSPFHQMANISCFLRAIRALGVREQVLFETLDLFNENRLSQVVRCLFSLSELVRTTMPSYHGPYLAAPGKPRVDPAVLHLVDLAKGNVMPAPGWGGPMTPGAISTASTGGANTAGQAPSPSRNHAFHHSGCLSPAAHEAGKLTYGIYEGGGVATKPLATSPIVGRSGGQQRAADAAAAAAAAGEGGGVVVGGDTDSAAGTTAAEALEEQLQAEEHQADRVAVGGGGVAAAVEYAESGHPVVNTPRVPPATPGRTSSREPMNRSNWTRTMSISTPRQGEDGGSGKNGFGPGSLEEQAKRRREATARSDTEMEVALWIEGVTGETFPGKFWSSLKDGVVLCKLMDSIVPGLIKPGLPHTSRGTFPELENLSAFLSACRAVGVAEHSLFDPKDLHEKRDMQAVVRCLHVLGAAVQSTVPEFKGPFLGKRSEALSVVNARGLRKRLGKGPGARGGIHTLNAHKGGGTAGEHFISPGDIPIEHPDPTATMTPAESPSAKRTSRRRDASDSAAGSGGRLHAPVSPRAMAEGLCGALLPAVIMEEEAGMTSAVVRVEKEGRRGARVVEEVGGGGRRNLAGLFASTGGGAPREDGAAGGAKEARILRRAVSSSGASGVSGSRRRGRARTHHEEEEEDRGEGVVSQIQRFIEQHTHQPWRISGDLHESLRDGWQLVLLANALRPGAVRRVHNSIQPAKQVQNIANFLIACRRMGVARALLFDIEDLYEDKSKTRVARTLLALRALAADPDFARARPSSLMGTSLLVTAAALAQATPQTAAAAAAAAAAADSRR